MQNMYFRLKPGGWQLNCFCYKNSPEVTQRVYSLLFLATKVHEGTRRKEERSKALGRKAGSALRANKMLVAAIRVSAFSPQAFKTCPQDTTIIPG